MTAAVAGAGGMGDPLAAGKSVPGRAAGEDRPGMAGALAPELLKLIFKTPETTAVPGQPDGPVADGTEIVPIPPPGALEDAIGVPTGESEEPPELIPENPVPWHDSLLELPEWMGTEEREIAARTRPANHGGGLFPLQVWPMEPEPPLGPLIPDVLLWQADARVRPSGEAAQTVTPVRLSPEFLEKYTGVKPARVFADPQHLMRGRSPEQMESLVRRWLNEQCLFPATVLVFGAGQELPAEFDPQQLRRQWFGDDSPALLVLYFYGQPERTQTIFSPQTLAAYGGSLVRSVVNAAVTEAGRVPGGPEQFERFCYKMSVRLHWMARTRAPEMAAAAARARVEQDEEEKTARRRRNSWAVAGLSLVMAAAGIAWHHRRKRQAPDPGVDPAASGPEPVMVGSEGLKPGTADAHSLATVPVRMPESLTAPVAELPAEGRLRWRMPPWWRAFFGRRRHRAASGAGSDRDQGNAPPPVCLPEPGFPRRLGAPCSGGFSSVIVFSRTGGAAGRPAE